MAFFVNIHPMTAETIPLEQYTQEITSLRNENKYLKEQLDWFKRQIFGQKADKFVDPKGEQYYFKGFDQIVPAKSVIFFMMRLRLICYLLERVKLTKPTCGF
jgi:hypothetical protein